MSAVKGLKVESPAMAHFFQQITSVILWLWLFVFYFGLQHHVPFRLSKYNSFFLLEDFPKRIDDNLSDLFEIIKGIIHNSVSVIFN